MKIPEYYNYHDHDNKELIYYILVVFPRAGYGKTINKAYKTEAGAIRAARSALHDDPGARCVDIRKETVLIRRDNCELSTSGVYKSISREAC